MNLMRPVLTAILLASAFTALHAEQLPVLRGTCSLAHAPDSKDLDLRLVRGGCATEDQCGTEQMQQPANAFTGITPSDLERDGAPLTATMKREAGTLVCAGVAHGSRLEGSYTFTPDATFVSRMETMGFKDLDSEKLEAYTLFGIDTEWIQSLRTAGVGGLDSGKLIALRIFKVDAPYVRSMEALGYPAPEADKLIALRVQKVDPAEVKQIRALGYSPTLDQLVEMRIFQVTPDYIRRMQSKGVSDLTISKLVQMRIFKIAD